MLSTRDSNSRASQTFGQCWLTKGLLAVILKVCVIAFSASSSTSVYFLSLHLPIFFSFLCAILLIHFLAVFRTYFYPPLQFLFLFSNPLIPFTLSIHISFLIFLFLLLLDFLFIVFVSFLFPFSFFLPPLFPLVPFFKEPNALTLFKTFGLWG